jgi:hypothetical protein
MPGGAVISAPEETIPQDASRVEAPVTAKAYLMCAFAAFGGIFFGYDSGYISGVLGMKQFIMDYEGLVRDFYTTRIQRTVTNLVPLGPSYNQPR